MFQEFSTPDTYHNGFANFAYLQGYSFSWDVEDGILASVQISFSAQNDEAFLGLNGGVIGSDGAIGTSQRGLRPLPFPSRPRSC